MYLLFKLQINRFFYRPSKKQREDIVAFLEFASPYFVALSKALKEKFIHRFHVFARSKNFAFLYEEPDKKRIVFTACSEMTRITFGFNDYLLADFIEIYFHPQEYYLNAFGALAHGHTSTRGIVTLSTPKMEEGFRNTTDGNNLLLHELAHALFIQKSKIDIDKRYAKGYQDWRNAAVKYMHLRGTNQPAILKVYAYSNIDEMLAVSTEVFFERSQEMKQNMPELFLLMTKLYNQNPIATDSPVLDNSFLGY